MAANASAGPWRIEPCARPERVLVRNAGTIVERDLPPEAAAYLVALRTIADALLYGAPTPRRRRAMTRDLARHFQTVNAEWVFVAANLEGPLYYLHNCLTRLGAGTLTATDAAFIDAAKTALPKLLADPRGALARRVFLPRRGRQSRLSSEAIAGEYAAFAGSERDFHQLSGRFDVSERTIATITPIVAHLPLAPSDHVLDIGCGDATLLKRIGPLVASAAGTVVSAAELARLQAAPELARFTFHQARFEDIAALPGIYDVIVANGCFHFVMDTRGAHRALAAMVSRLRPGGRIWIGEQQTRDHLPPRVFATPRRALWYALRRYGPRFALRYGLHLARRRHRPHVIVERAPRDGWWICTPTNMARLVAAHGLRIVGSWDCYELTGDTFYRVEGRRSYLLVRD